MDLINLDKDKEYFHEMIKMDVNDYNALMRKTSEVYCNSNNLSDVVDNLINNFSYNELIIISSLAISNIKHYPEFIDK